MELKKLFEGITDPRETKQQTYPFEYLMLISICSFMAGIDSFVGVEDYATVNKAFFDRYFGARYIPKHDTFNRLFQKLCPRELEVWFRKQASILIQFIEKNKLPTNDEASKNQKKRHIPIDGKTVRNSGVDMAYHIVTAWCSNYKITLGQIKVAEKSNEITAIPLLIDSMDVKDAVITIDAIGCQREICEKIIKKEGHYIIAVKDNQPTLFSHVMSQIEEDFDEAYSICKTDNKGHGRKESRQCFAQSFNSKKFNGNDWPGLTTIYCVDSDVTRKKKNGDPKRSMMTRYFVSNIRLDADQALEIIRNHWGIEVNLHWCLDVSFNEDGACVVLENAVINGNIFRKYALNVHQLVKEKRSIKTMFRLCGNPMNAIKFLDKIYDA
jgi:predicted transposase YbfD/YdcC